MKKVLVIGAGVGQVELVKKAKGLGCYVITVTSSGNWPAIQYSDENWDIDIYKKELILRKAEEAKIDAVCSSQNDLMVPTVCYIAEKLGLPGSSYKTALMYCDKNIYKSNCDILGLPVARHFAVKDIKNISVPTGFKYPMIVKPTDSQSSIGVKRVENYSELVEALKVAMSKSKKSEAIVEEYFVGDEIVSVGFILDGKYYFLCFGEKEYFNRLDIRVPCSVHYIAKFPKDIERRIVDCEKKMVSYTKPSLGIVYTEYLFNRTTNDIVIVESALRGPGMYCTSHLIPLATGVDLEKLMLKLSLGIKVNIIDELEPKFYYTSGYISFYLDKGRIKKIDGINKIKDLPYVNECLLDDITIGMETSPLTYKGDRKGPIIFTDKTFEGFEKKKKIIMDTLKIDVENSGIVHNGIRWN